MREISGNLPWSYYTRMGACADIFVKLGVRDLKSIIRLHVRYRKLS